jgi:hypothetical protein
MSAPKRVLSAVEKLVPQGTGRTKLLTFFGTQSETLQRCYADMLESVVAYRDILIEHRIGEYQASQKEKVKNTAGLVGLQVPILFEDVPVLHDESEQKKREFKD